MLVMSVSAVLVVLVEHVAADDHAADLTGTFADGDTFIDVAGWMDCIHSIIAFKWFSS